MERDGFPIEAAIEDVADEYERIFAVKVSLEARMALIQPAIEHRAAIQLELDEGKITREEIRSKIMEQIALADTVGRRRRPFKFRESSKGQRRSISGVDAEDAMKERCMLMFWC